MRNVDVILEAIYVLDILYEEFEKKAGLQEGRLRELKERPYEDLSNEELAKVAAAYSNQFEEVGYHLISNTLFSEMLVTKDRINLE
jgi:hypothetical protein